MGRIPTATKDYSTTRPLKVVSEAAREREAYTLITPTVLLQFQHHCLIVLLDMICPSPTTIELITPTARSLLPTCIPLAMES